MGFWNKFVDALPFALASTGVAAVGIGAYKGVEYLLRPSEEELAKAAKAKAMLEAEAQFEAMGKALAPAVAAIEPVFKLALGQMQAMLAAQEPAPAVAAPAHVPVQKGKGK